MGNESGVFFGSDSADVGSVEHLESCVSITNKNTFSEPFTMEMLEEAKALITALAPKEAPEGVNLIKGLTGLNIMKNEMIPENTIMVSKKLFDLIYESGSKKTRG